MIEHKRIGRKAQNFFEDIWKRGDYWNLERSGFERSKYARQLTMLGERHYGRVLEIGCGAGCFTRLLAQIADYVLALDIAPTAIRRARVAGVAPAKLEFRAENIMDHDLRADDPWNLVVISETIYYLGWLYPFFDIAWLASELLAATSSRGRLLMTNTCGGTDDYLLQPWLIRTYRDLFLNVGYQLEAEEIFRGTKNNLDLDVLISLFVKAPENMVAAKREKQPEPRIL